MLVIFVHGMPSFYGALGENGVHPSSFPSADPPGHQTLGRHGKGLELHDRQRNGKILDNVKSAIAKDGVYCQKGRRPCSPAKEYAFQLDRR